MRTIYIFFRVAKNDPGLEMSVFGYSGRTVSDVLSSPSNALKHALYEL